MTLKLRSLKLSGFLSYFNEVNLDLDSGVIAIIGENGSGKSSLVDAFYYSLTQPQQAVRVGKKTDLVNRRSPRARITLRLVDETSEEEIIYIIESTIDKKGTSQVILRKGKRVEASGVKAVREKLSEILGIERAKLETIIGSSVIIRQGGLDNIVYLLSSGENREKVKFFENVFGLSEYSKAKDLMGELSIIDVKVKNTEYSLAPTRTWRREIERLISRLRKEERELKNKLKVTKERLFEYERDKKELEKKVEELRKKVDELNQVKGEILTLEQRKGRLREEITKLSSEFNDMNKKLKDIEKNLTEIMSVAKYAQYRDKASKYHELNSMLSKLLFDIRRLKEIKDALALIISNKDTRQEFNEIKTSLERLRKSYKELHIEMGELEGRIKELQAQIKRAIDDIENIFGEQKIISESEGNLEKNKVIY